MTGLSDISAAKAGVAGLPSNQIIKFASEYAGEREPGLQRRSTSA